MQIERSGPTVDKNQKNNNNEKQKKIPYINNTREKGNIYSLLPLFRVTSMPIRRGNDSERESFFPLF